MSASSLIDPSTGKISLNYLPEGQQGFITNVVAGNNDISVSVSLSGVATLTPSQQPTFTTMNATQQIRLGDEAQAIPDQVVLDSSGLTITNGDLTIENGSDTVILQAGPTDRLLVNAGTVAYTSELPTVALTGGANISITNNSVGSAYSFQVSATGDLGVASVVSSDPNIVVTGTENISLALANDLNINNNIEALNGIFDNSINVQGEAIIQGGIDMTADGSDCILFTVNDRLTVNSNEVAYLTDIPTPTPNTAITAGTGISVANPSVNTFTITNTIPATTVSAGTGISVANPSAGAFTVANTGVTALTAGSNVSLSGSTGNVTINTTGVGAVNAGANIQVSGLQSSRQVALANAVNITSGNSFNFNSGSSLSINTPITTNAPPNNANNAINLQVPLVSDGTAGPSAGLTIQTAPGSATNGNVALALNAPDNVFSTTFFAPATTGTTGGTTAGQLNLWGYPSSASPFYHSFNTNQAYANLTIAPDGSQVVVGNVIGGNAFTQTANTGCQLKVAGTNSSGNGIVYGRVYDDTFYLPPTATPPTITAGPGIIVGNPSPNTFLITNSNPLTAITAGANTTVSNPSNNIFTIGSSVPSWGLGTSSGNTAQYLYNNTNFGTQNVSIPLTSLVTQTGLYMFQISCYNQTGSIYPAPGGGAIIVFLQGTPASQISNSASQFISSYDVNAVSGLVRVNKSFFQKMNAGQQYNLGLQPNDANYNNNFTIWNIGISVNVVYLGAMSN